MKITPTTAIMTPIVVAPSPSILLGRAGLRGQSHNRALRSGCGVERLAQPKRPLGRDLHDWCLLLDEEAMGRGLTSWSRDQILGFCLGSLL